MPQYFTNQDEFDNENPSLHFEHQEFESEVQVPMNITEVAFDESFLNESTGELVTWNNNLDTSD